MNKKLITLCASVALVLSVSCKKQEPIAPPPPPPVQTQIPAGSASTASPQPESNVLPADIAFTEEIHDFGTINQGDKVSHFFTFKNTGENDLIITKAMGSCGCTVPEFPKEAIAPGKSEKMKVTFSSAGKSGHVEKTVTIHANIPDGVKVIRIKANILVK